MCDGCGDGFGLCGEEVVVGIDDVVVYGYG